MSRPHRFPPPPPIPTARARLNAGKLAAVRAADRNRCVCGKMVAYSVEEARLLVDAVASEHGDASPVWFYACHERPRVVHWTRREHPTDPPYHPRVRQP